MSKVRKAVIPVAGLGTRFLPATKAVPKELLPIVDVPAIQVVIEEVVAAGIEQVILITGRSKGAIMDHFDHSYELEDTLRRRGQTELIEAIDRISEMVRAVAIRQKAPLGLGHAVLCAKDTIGDEPFVVLLPDDIIDAKRPATAQLVEQYERYGAGVVSLMKVPSEDTSMYGIIAGDRMDERTHRVFTLVEKPRPENAPSNLAVIGRYVLPPEIFGYLEATRPGHGGEIQLTDALQALATERGLVGYEFEGTRHDIGDKFGFLKANIEYALKRSDLGPALRAYLETIDK
ncbi:MAG: UTP--glucose-1-phosphate uridylyltransferase GalU [Myxococcales bacterium]|nr:UTP--glucose-1-phosphate uridylyltransferase GalU [Myxococcales bacterium]MCB9519612.1 UTP--glucose-1-phosphate uridylyltransferase GalU [Myxococcales bacterium]MCB9530661.1 UTP--glucose-1-phosphate uridylyltransferase GalU [Myxococcales bacterium]MCB9533582.1 UTP--glucose-1-phosphate uridylyltransferase GalU [Myxococcales bacterium]